MNFFNRQISQYRELPRDYKVLRFSPNGDKTTVYRGNEQQCQLWLCNIVDINNYQATFIKYVDGCKGYSVTSEYGTTKQFKIIGETK